MAQQERPKRSASRKGYGCLVIALLVIGLFCGVVAYDRSSKAKTEAQHRAQTERQKTESAAQERQKQEIIQRLAQKHHAITADWDKKAKEGYTADLQKSMIRNDGQPIIFISYLHDVVQKEDRYVLFFGSQRRLFLTYWSLETPMWYYVIECEAEHTKVLWEDTRKKGNKEFAVVAVISAVSKPRFEVRAKATLGSEFAEDEARIILDASTTTFVARGSCVELLPLSVQASEEKTENQRPVPYRRRMERQ